MGQSSGGEVMPMAGEEGPGEGDSVTSGASSTAAVLAPNEGPLCSFQGRSLPSDAPSLSHTSDMLADLAQPFVTTLPACDWKMWRHHFCKDAGGAGLNTPPMPQRMEVRATTSAGSTED